MPIGSEVFDVGTHLILYEPHYLCVHAAVVEAELLFEDLDVARGYIQILYLLAEHCSGEFGEHAASQALGAFCIKLMGLRYFF